VYGCCYLNVDLCWPCLLFKWRFKSAGHTYVLLHKLQILLMLLFRMSGYDWLNLGR
jgi:hypothetical protein